MNTWAVWQIIDSGFPTGGFAHSWGLEAAWQGGEVTDDAELGQFLRDTISQVGHASLPFVTAAHGDPSRLPELDALSDVFLTNVVANRASRVQGGALLATCARTWPIPAMSALDQRSQGLCRHCAPIFGAVMRALDIPAQETQRMCLFLATRGVLGAAVRLGIVGSYRAQRLQHECSGDLNGVLERCGTLTEADVAQTAPLIDLLQAAHDRLYSRLFQS
jgi:urease accessory protein